eukprot:COSAG02_NODE_11154_length_1782_cov_1.877005_2_plen_319_part_01
MFFSFPTAQKVHSPTRKIQCVHIGISTMVRVEIYRKDRGGAAEIFSQLDSDGSGFLDSEELRKLLKKMGFDLGQGDVLKIMREMDASGDGRVGFTEFDAWWAENGDKNQYQLKDPSIVFRQVDADGSGALDRDELKQLLKQLGQTKIRDEHVTELMEELDTDGDGGVSYEEFEQWWRQNGGKKYKTREQRQEEEVALGGQKGIKGRLRRQKSKLMDLMTDNADDSAALHRKSKRADMIHTLEGSDPLASPVSKGSPDQKTFWNPLGDEHVTRPSSGSQQTTADGDGHDVRPSTSGPQGSADVQPPRGFSVRFSEKKPLG